jgi:hypothetical protein
MMMEALCSSETSVPTRATRCNISEDGIFQCIQYWVSVLHKSSTSYSIVPQICNNLRDVNHGAGPWALGWKPRMWLDGNRHAVREALTSDCANPAGTFQHFDNSQDNGIACLQRILLKSLNPLPNFNARRRHMKLLISKSVICSARECGRTCALVWSHFRHSPLITHFRDLTAAKRVAVRYGH